MPKYYLRKSFNYTEWWAICQTKNNVILAEVSSEELAELILEFVNSLPASIGHLKIGNRTENLRKIIARMTADQHNKKAK